MIYVPPSQLHTIGAATLARSNLAPSLARGAINDWLETTHPAREITVLAASELVANAVQHSNAMGASASVQETQDVITLSVAQGSDYLRLAVTDPGSSGEGPSMIPLQVPGPNAEHGRGLAIVNALSRGRWGSYRLPHAGLRLVWCHLDLTPTPAELNALFCAPAAG
ncbi:ATP-binding protein [Nonomuraea soli]|uniref:Anti-sigma regulatory factor (Ser/Thr protein kinase) n=1 Tax=Nonomuraea soli TaxID=1032476 RepID=A0A7W0CUL9_9ACTN|nr:ATP-binding protein [Nonomuraea soli]MBA2897649.1 anti-sigma regulatory factor (Ser/Thr protein kinase) [Nonomuraea soli]